MEVLRFLFPAAQHHVKKGIVWWGHCPGVLALPEKTEEVSHMYNLRFKKACFYRFALDHCDEKYGGNYAAS